MKIFIGLILGSVFTVLGYLVFKFRAIIGYLIKELFKKVFKIK